MEVVPQPRPIRRRRRQVHLEVEPQLAGERLLPGAEAGNRRKTSPLQELGEQRDPIAALAGVVETHQRADDPEPFVLFHLPAPTCVGRGDRLARPNSISIRPTLGGRIKIVAQVPIHILRFGATHRTEMLTQLFGGEG